MPVVAVAVGGGRVAVDDGVEVLLVTVIGEVADGLALGVGVELRPGVGVNEGVALGEGVDDPVAVAEQVADGVADGVPVGT